MASALHDAAGTWVCGLPHTPERVKAALKQAGLQNTTLLRIVRLMSSTLYTIDPMCMKYCTLVAALIVLSKGKPHVERCEMQPMTHCAEPFGGA